MQRLILLLLLCLTVSATATAKQKNSVFIDSKGIMRYTDSGKEASFFGVNYTVPFAHAYRALGYLDSDRKAAIDRDLYHFARLGFNAYRIHIWDVEISDRQGNLLSNDHLELLDYLIYRLKERDIKIVLTTMTNFGNGYPERNQPTGAFTYDYDKCAIHDDPAAREAQQRYIAQLISHVNPYTGLAYMSDPDVVGFEINNEPCHAGTQQQTKEYIDSMLAAMKRVGNQKPVFYNVSHNMQQIEAYYDTKIQGTTYQWYPIGLVAGHTRKGNFLPYIDNYSIPFRDVKGFNNKAMLVYEYDPADITYSYMHPAMVRSFRSAGFQWITQFAYDPIDMAAYNTEYQTHYLNLAYTPQKALSMKIAAEVAYRIPRGARFEAYPKDTLFGEFRVSYQEDLSLLNSPTAYFHSNHTDAIPIAPEQLQSVAGYGNSPLVRYEGKGAYFIDRLESGLWRLELMPDAQQVLDPFAKPSLQREAVVIMHNRWDMQLQLPDLGSHFTATAINDGNSDEQLTTDATLKNLAPGVYLLRRQGLSTSEEWSPDRQWNNIRLNEFVAPDGTPARYQISHTPHRIVENNRPLILSAELAGPAMPDSLLIYSDGVSFWSQRNPIFKMERKSGYRWEATIPAEQLRGDRFRYHIVVYNNGKATTFPDGVAGEPLAWDFSSDSYFATSVVAPDAPVILHDSSDDPTTLETYTMPEWSMTKRVQRKSSPAEEKTLQVTFSSRNDSPRFFIHKYIREEVRQRLERLQTAHYLCLHIQQTPPAITVGFVTNQGITYTTRVEAQPGILRIPLDSLTQQPTALLPHPYPVFLDNYFTASEEIGFNITDIEKLTLSMEGEKEIATEITLGTIWIE